MLGRRRSGTKRFARLNLLEFEGSREAGGVVGSTPKIAAVECKPEQLRPERDARASIIYVHSADLEHTILES